MSWGRKQTGGDRLPWRTQGIVAVGTLRRKIAEGTRAVGRTGRAVPDLSREESETAMPDVGGAHRTADPHERGGRAS